MAELVAKNYVVQEVNFATMLSIVQSCQELQAERFNESLKLPTHESEFHREPETSNFFTLFKGIAPGEKVQIQEGVGISMQLLITTIVLSFYHHILFIFNLQGQNGVA